MQSKKRRRLARWALGLMAAAAIAGPALPVRAESAAEARAAVSAWPLKSRLAAKALIERYGAPRRSDGNSLTWYGPGDWKKTVVSRSDAGEGPIAQTIDYRVPDSKWARVQEFDGGITSDKSRGELTVRSDSEATNFLAANLAHEVASGFKTPRQAREFYDKTLRLAEAGKSSRYLDGLVFVQKPEAPMSSNNFNALSYSNWSNWSNWPTPKSLPDGKYTPPY